MKNIETVDKLAGIIDIFLEHASRINEAKPQKYWYPLSMATYDSREILQALDSLCSFRTTMWEKTKMFERLFGEFQGSSFSAMVNSGSSADLLMCFMLMNRGKGRFENGDEILIPIVTWPTQIWSAMMAGFKVKLVDVNPQTLNIDIDDLSRKISSRSKAIFVTHLMGNPCDMDKILKIAGERGLAVIEDCCEALGSTLNGVKVGNFGVAGSFSFFFSHHISTMEGGMIVTNDKEMDEEFKILRAHGWARNINPGRLEMNDVDPRYAFLNWGFNVRPTEINAGFGICQMEKLPYFNERREALSGRFWRFISGSPYLKKPSTLPKANPSWFALPMIVEKNAPFTKGQLLEYLEKSGVETRPVVAGNLARQPVAALFAEFREDKFPGADEIHERGFYIGLSPMTSDADMDRLTGVFEKFLRKYT